MSMYTSSCVGVSKSTATTTQPALGENRSSCGYQGTVSRLPDLEILFLAVWKSVGLCSWLFGLSLLPRSTAEVGGCVGLLGPVAHVMQDRIDFVLSGGSKLAR